MALNLHKRNEGSVPLTWAQVDNNWQQIEDAINANSVDGSTAVFEDVILEANIYKAFLHNLNSQYFIIQFWQTNSNGFRELCAVPPGVIEVRHSDNPTAKFFVKAIEAFTVTITITKVTT